MSQSDEASETAKDEPDVPDEQPSLLPEDEGQGAPDDGPSLLPDDDEEIDDDEPTLLPEQDEEETEAAVEEPEEEDKPEVEPHIFAIKTTINQETSVGKMIADKADKHDVDVLSILHPTEIRGYLFVEALNRLRLEEMVRGLPHMRGMVEGETDLDEVQHFLTPKPSVEGIAEGDIVELISGPFKGERARVQRIDEGKEEITVELFEAMVPIPVTVSGDAVRVLEKGED